MKRFTLAFMFIVCLFAMVSCGKKGKAKDIVTNFMTAVTADSTACKEYYPDWDKLVINLPQGTFTADEEVTEQGDTTIVTGKYAVADRDSVQLKFFMIKDGNGDLKIKDSYGFLEYSEDPELVAFAKKSGAYKSDQFLAENWLKVRTFQESSLDPNMIDEAFEIQKGGSGSYSKSQGNAEPSYWLRNNFTLKNKLNVDVKGLKVQVTVRISGHDYCGYSFSYSQSRSKTFDIAAGETIEGTIACPDPWGFSEGYNDGHYSTSFTIKPDEAVMSAIAGSQEMTGNEYDAYIAQHPEIANMTSASRQSVITPAAPVPSSNNSSGGFTTENYSWVLTKKASESDFAGLSKDELRLVRNYIFAKHGYIFKDHSLGEYFSQFSWYHPTSHDVGGELNSTESYNVQVIKSLE